jgi:hypothetical protein
MVLLVMEWVYDSDEEKFLDKDRVTLKVAFFTVSIQWVLTLIKWMLMSDG